MDKVNVKRKKVTITLIIVFFICLFISLVWMYNTGNFITEKYTVNVVYEEPDIVSGKILITNKVHEIVEINDDDAIAMGKIIFNSYLKVFEDVQKIENNTYYRKPLSYAITDSDGNIIYLSNK